MIEIIRSIIIGGVQGISEFFPISSSGHLVLIPYIFKWDYSGLSYDVALHFGTAIAIIAYFWRDWIRIFSNAFGFDKKNEISLPKNFLWQIMVASIPAAIAGFFLNDIVEQKLHSPLLIAFDLLFFGVVLWLVDKYSRSTNNIQHQSYGRSFLIGCSQAMALIPGVSRSGITISAARAVGINKKDAARISFLLSTPAVIGAFLFKIKDIEANDFNVAFIIGVISSTVFGFLAIKYLLKYLERGNFSVFVWYRVALAIIILAIFLLR